MIRGIPAGTTRTALALVKAPPFPGDYRLSIDLVQVHGAPLSACGVLPLEVAVRVGEKATPP